jgi:hypothetical protein
MPVTCITAGKPEPTGLWLPQFGKPYYRTMQAFTEALQAEQWEVLQVLLRLGAHVWQHAEGKALIREYLADFRSDMAPSDVPIPPIS